MVKMVSVRAAMEEIFTVQEMKEIRGVAFACKFQGGNIVSVDLTKISNAQSSKGKNTIEGGDNNERD